MLTEHIAAMQNAEGVTNPVTLAHAHKNANNFAETLSAVNSYLEKLEARIEEISTVPPEGRVTRAYFSEVSERHKTEISAIVDSIRKRIDLRNSEQNPAPSTQIAAVLGRLDRIEIFIGSLNPATVSPSTSTAH